jgi:hypothetical protein
VKKLVIICAAGILLFFIAFQFSEIGEAVGGKFGDVAKIMGDLYYSDKIVERDSAFVKQLVAFF